jgi:hypothetical protein
VNVQCLKLFRNRVRLVDSRQTFARPLRDRTSAPHEAFPVMIDAIASSLGSMMVGYGCSFPARMDKQLMEVGQALGLHHQTVKRCVERAAAEGPMAALNDRPRPGREPTITLEAKAWLTWLSCRKAKELGYPHELWTARLLARHAREHGPAEGHPCLANTKMAVARVAAPDWSCAGSRGGGANPRHRTSGCRRHTAGLRHRACASAGH